MRKLFSKFKFSYLLATFFTLNIANNARPQLHVVIIKDCGKFLQSGVQLFDAFLSKKDSRTYSNYLEELENMVNNHPFTKHPECKSNLGKEVQDIKEEVMIHFSQAHIILEKYKNKSKKDAPKLINELKKALPISTLLSKLKTKLICLKEKAKLENNADLVKVIDRFVIFIDKKVKIWNSKSQLELASAVYRRMGLR